MLGLTPPRSKSGPSLNFRATPVNPLPKASADSLRRPVAGVVQIVVVPVVTFENEEVVEFPEKDQRKRQLADLVQFAVPACAFQVVVPGCPQDSRGC